jgi:hypothetical protein
VFENRVFVIIFEPKRNKVTKEWRRLHVKKLHNLMRCAGWACSFRGRIRNAYTSLAGKPEGKRQLTRS